MDEFIHMHMSASAIRQRHQTTEMSGPLELELLVQMWVLRIKLGCSETTAHVLYK